MPIPRTPATIQQLDLMKRLNAYAKGTATWQAGGRKLDDEDRQACAELHAHLCELVGKVFGPMMDKIGSREMECFTMHDRKHGLKVAHLMWHILKDGRRRRLTPPEIALLVAAAHLHDFGMGLSTEERQARLAPESDLWTRLELDEQTKARIEKLRERLADPNVKQAAKIRVEQQLLQAEEALLCQDTRERHASPERYRELLQRLRDYHNRDAANIPDIDSCFSFEGDSFRDELIEICVSHNEQAESLIGRDAKNPAYPRFRPEFPLGSCTANLKMVAAALRLADILDFDRERTPPALFQYLFPGPLAPEENRSVLEWSKHLAISHWCIERSAVVFRGQCTDHVIHHAVVQFRAAIQEEITETRLALATDTEDAWPFSLPSDVKAEIVARGYTYVPYRFELDDQRVYSLLMGGAIYDNPLVAVRELTQNAVDACTLRDRLRELHDPGSRFSTKGRIVVSYQDPSPECPQPRLSVKDTGTGMDEYILKTYFLKVGQSYYRSTEFLKHRIELRKHNVDFAPISEFGIGFLSCFLLADRVKVETAAADGWRCDNRKRTLLIDGPTRLIRLSEEPNAGAAWKGTQVTLYLTRGSGQSESETPTWLRIKGYIENVCQELPYELHLYHNGTEQAVIQPGPKSVVVPPDLEPFAFRVPMDNPQAGFDGEIVLFDWNAKREADAERLKGFAAMVDPSENRRNEGQLLRGGFLLGDLPGMPSRSIGRIRLRWDSQPGGRYFLPNLARNRVAETEDLRKAVLGTWFRHLYVNRAQVPAGVLEIYAFTERGDPLLDVLRSDEQYDALGLYELARKAWTLNIPEDEVSAWESGRRSAHLPGYLHGLYERLLCLVLPSIATRELDREGSLLVAAPVSNWRSVLKGSRRFLDDDGYGPWATFPGSRSDWLATLSDYDETILNARYRERIESLFDEMERGDLTGAIHNLLVGARSLDADQSNVWERARAEFKGLTIGKLSRRTPEFWPVESLKVLHPHHAPGAGE